MFFYNGVMRTLGREVISDSERVAGCKGDEQGLDGGDRLTEKRK